MKEVAVPSLNMKGLSGSLEQLSLSKSIQDVAFLPIDCINWPQYSYKPETLIKLIQLTDGLILNFKVFESNIKASVNTSNGPVYNDSCVEFFIDPKGDGFYYNFEFNCIGRILLGYGDSRHNRGMASEEVLSQIKTISSLGEKAFDEIVGPLWWNLIVFIPFTCFFKHQIIRLEGDIHGNFYKCGNATKIPHYVSWNPIKSDAPDFHRPECFGRLKFKPTTDN